MVDEKKPRVDVDRPPLTHVASYDEGDEVEAVRTVWVVGVRKGRRGTVVKIAPNRAAYRVCFDGSNGRPCQIEVTHDEIRRVDESEKTRCVADGNEPCLRCDAEPVEPGYTICRSCSEREIAEATQRRSERT